MLHGLIDFLFPAQCAGCDAIGGGLCDQCFPPSLPTRTRMLPTLALTALGDYDGALKRAVLALKDGRRDVALALGERLRVFVRYDMLLVPVPTTNARRRVRGIDGVESIAHVAAEHTGATVLRALEPVGTDAQRGRDRAGRLAGRGRFRAISPVIEGSDITLVDDVCTTGATLEDCAAALRAAGAHVSQAFVVAVANGRA